MTYVRVDPAEIVLEYGQRLNVCDTGVVQFHTPDLERPVCMSKYDLAELLRIACGSSLLEAVKCLTFVIEHGHRFSEVPWVPLRTVQVLDPEDAF